MYAGTGLALEARGMMIVIVKGMVNLKAMKMKMRILPAHKTHQIHEIASSLEHLC